MRRPTLIAINAVFMSLSSDLIDVFECVSGSDTKYDHVMSRELRTVE